MPTVLITGANRGLGLAHARRYADRGWRVIACRRTPESDGALDRLAADADDVRIEAYDAADAVAPKRMSQALAGEPIDVLLNNAGVIGPRPHGQGLEDASPATLAETIAVNALAPLALTQALLDNVASSERRVIANQSSLMGSIEDNGSGGYYAYRASKAALNMITRSLARDLAGRGVKVVALHPGWVRTDMGGASAKLTPEDSAAGEQDVIDGLTPERSGRFFNYDGRELPW